MRFTFLEQLLLNLVGPLALVCFGTFGLRLLTDRVSRRRATTELRQRLAFEMTEAAYGLYFGLTHHRRQIAHRRMSDDIATDARRALDADYVRQRVAMGAIQARLEVYFDKETEPSRGWHRVIDLLTAFYFTVVRAPETQLDEVRRRVGGREHTGLTVQQLADPDQIIAAFEASLPASVTSVLRSPLNAASIEGLVS